MSQDQSRRAFLRRSAALGVAGAAAPFVTNLAGIGEAAAATTSDYKALVCVFLYGGNDYANTLPPYDQASYDLYNAARPTLALPRATLAATALTPSVPLAGGRQYALAPTMSSLLPVFNAGRMAVILNVGALVRPTSKAEYLAKTASQPSQLFSHSHQQNYWQASADVNSVGWGGRLGDLFESGNGSAALTCVNASGNALYLAGRNAIQYSIGPGGPVPLLGNASTLYGSAQAASALRSLMRGGNAHLLADAHAAISRRSLDAYAQLTSALAGAPEHNFPLFPGGNSLADQLRIVARMISVSRELGVRRQVFFVSLGTFDLHDSLGSLQPVMLRLVADAMRGFYDTTVALGVADKVTSFTASDFGRTLQPNNDGSDHGWGGMHFVMGGAVNGGRFYGTAPEIGNDTPDDVGQGRLLPTISVDQYAATLASWYGVSAGEMSTVLPNIGNYNSSSWNLGFV